MTDSIATHGWTAQPRDVSILLSGKKNIKSPEPVKVEDIPLPDSQLAMEVMKYAKKELREETFNHSMRVYYYGMHTHGIQMRCGLCAGSYGWGLWQGWSGGWGWGWGWGCLAGNSAHWDI